MNIPILPLLKIKVGEASKLEELAWKPHQPKDLDQTEIQKRNKSSIDPELKHHQEKVIFQKCWSLTNKDIVGYLLLNIIAYFFKISPHLREFSDLNYR